MDAFTFNTNAWINMFSETMTNGGASSPRGIAIKELLDYQLTIRPEYPFMTFHGRKYDVGYFKKEMLWKLSASKYDESIKEHATMWSKVQNPDGTFNSNYGQYWFGEQAGMWNVICELLRDRDSRRAVIPMLSKEHMTPQTVDTVCTESVGFHIRKNTLYMSVHMRSSDQIFGLGTDIPTFSFLYRLIHAVLVERYPNLEIGTINISAMSSHIYSRHFAMVEQIIAERDVAPHKTYMPFIKSSIEAMSLVASRGEVSRLVLCPGYATGGMARWLLENSNVKT